MKPRDRFDGWHSIQARLLAGFAAMLLLQITVSISMSWATKNADTASAASAAAEHSISIVGAALDGLADTQLRLADFLRTGDAADRAKLVAVIDDFDGALRGVMSEGTAPNILGESGVELERRLASVVEAAVARREASANTEMIITQNQNALTAMAAAGARGQDRATADATSSASIAALRPFVAISRYLDTQVAANEDNAHSELNELDLDLRAILMAAPDVPPRLQRLVQAAVDQLSRLNPALAAFDQANAIHTESLIKLNGTIERTGGSLRDYMHVTATQHDERSQTMHRARVRVRYTLAWAGVLGCLLAGGIATILGLSITRPLGRLSVAMHRLAAGALDITVPDRERRDEVGRMAEAMQVFKENMNRTAELEAEEDKLLTANARLEELARVDGLTGLANRRRFDETLETEFMRCARENIPLSLILIDVDRFKVFNDTYGHQAGDVCLQTLSAAVKRWARRASDLAARYGGEELAVVLPGASNHAAAGIAEQIRLAIRNLGIEHTGNAASVVTASFGVATVHPSYGGTPNDIIKSADQFLYAAKANGRDMVVAEASQIDSAMVGEPPVAPDATCQVGQSCDQP